jgi:signal transduction histidine kinase
MSWNKWLQQFGIGGGTAVLSAGGLIISCILIALIQFAMGKGLQLEGFFLAIAISILVIAPLAYLIMELLFSLDEADIDIIRKEAQVEYLKKFVSQQGNSVEKDQLIQDLNSFAQTVAHDLKNPLTTILGFATMLADHQANIPPEQQKDALQTIVKTSLKMNNIIQELLLLAAVRQSEMRTGPIQMASIVSATKQRLWGMLSESKAELVIPEQNTWPKVVGYAPWIEEVWINYISNAIKYGGTPARIELGSDPNFNKSPAGRNMARFWVKDNGNGIDHKDQSGLFTQFTRLDQVRAEGHGLGLAIVARVIEKLGGQVGVESEPGQGSLFYFTLPMVVIEPPTRVPTKIALKRS